MYIPNRAVAAKRAPRGIVDRWLMAVTRRRHDLSFGE
jgi:hypothetical protein